MTSLNDLRLDTMNMDGRIDNLLLIQRNTDTTTMWYFLLAKDARLR